MLKLLIAVDGSAHAQRAIETVAKMARAAVPPAFYGEAPAVSIEQIDAAQKQAQDHLLADAEARALGAGLTLRSTQRAAGSPAQEIVRMATEQGVDQIVMGTHGRGTLGSLFLGSVAQRVVHLSALPVLLVK